MRAISIMTFKKQERLQLLTTVELFLIIQFYPHLYRWRQVRSDDVGAQVPADKCWVLGFMEIQPSQTALEHLI